MRTKWALPVLVLLLIVLFGATWAVLRPQGSPLFPFPDLLAFSDKSAANKAACSPDDPNDEPVADKDDAQATTQGSNPAGAGKEAREGEITAQPSSPQPAAARPPAKTTPEAPSKPEQPDSRKPTPGREDKPKPRALLRGVRHPPNQSLGNIRPAARKLKDENGKKALDSVTPEIKQDRRGLLGRYYAFQSNPIEELADPNKLALESRTPGLTRIDQQVAFPTKAAFSDLPFDLANFFVVWEGFLVVPADGDFWLFLGADLGGRVVLDGETVLLNDMFSDYIEVSTVLTLSAGLHPLRIEYAEGKNGSVVSGLCACNFMHVPQGKAQPVSVPPEMLLLPETLWNSAAPIIESVSPKEAEIGAEVIIRGHNFAAEGLDSKSEEALAGSKVDFSGQPASVIEAGPTQIKVRVPIGAATGKLTVRKGEIPSNSVDFKVSTQFGLFASWHDMLGPSFDFVEPGSREPELVRLEREWQFASRNELELEFRNNPLACRWEGKLGVPKLIASTGEEPPGRLVRFRSHGRIRVSLGDQTRTSGAWIADQQVATVLDFEVPYGDERYLPLAIDFTNQAGAASLTVVWAAAGSGEGADTATIINAPVNFGEQLPSRLFFPPVVPPKPPRIVSVTPLLVEGAPAVSLPYDAEPGKISIREGQQFRLLLELYGSEEVRAQPVTLTCDGKPIEYTLDSEWADGGAQGQIYDERRMLICTLPQGCGEGKISARLTTVQSEPFHIDVANKGLITYLYDFPNGGGYLQLPEFGPLSCFKVRKDAWINFENANFLNLPFPAETFGIEWFGAIIIEVEGDYVFTARSDDGIRVWVNGFEAVVDDNLHYQREKRGEPMHLVPGTYSFQAQFFENNVHEVFVLEFEAKDALGNVNVPRQVVPKRLFTTDQHPPLPEKTSSGKLADGSSPQG